MEISDRNLIRRILLTLFPEELIIAGGKKMVMYTKYILVLILGLLRRGEGRNFMGRICFIC